MKGTCSTHPPTRPLLCALPGQIKLVLFAKPEAVGGAPDLRVEAATDGVLPDAVSAPAQQSARASIFERQNAPPHDRAAARPLFRDGQPTEQLSCSGAPTRLLPRR